VASFADYGDAAANEGGFRRVQGKTLSSQIVAQVRESLFANTLRPGDLLGSEAELAKQFGVSRMSVRDALRMLEAMGIVEIRMGAGGGARIAQASLDRFGDSLAIQLALIGVSPEEVLRAQGAIEGLTAELAAGNASSEDLRHMRELLDEAARHLDDGEMTSALGRAFHMAVAHASHNRVLEAQLSAMRDSLWRPGGMRVADRATARHVLATHEAIYEKIAKRDAEGARRLMSEHLEHILNKSSASVPSKQGGRGERSAVADHVCGGFVAQLVLER
jgi:GntR family transcriptional regulator, transcriptional repressor for pyruvate dehydrogenase complex